MDNVFPGPMTLETIRSTGIEAYHSEREPLACECLAVYLRYMPDDAFASFAFGDAARLIGRFNEARNALRRAYRMAPEEHHWTVAVRLALLYRYVGKYPLAEQWYQRALRSEEASATPYVWIMRGDNFGRMTRMEQAEEMYHTAIRLDEQYDEAYLELGRTLRSLGRYAEAEAAFQRVLEITPGDPLATELLATVIGLANQVQRLARCEFSIAKEADSKAADDFAEPMTLETLRRTGSDALRSGREPLAYECLAVYLRYRPDDAFAWRDFGAAAAAIGRTQEARSGLMKAYRMAPDELRGQIEMRLARFYSDAGKYQLAKKWFQRAASSSEGNGKPRFWVLRGANLSRMGLMEEAAQMYRTAIQFDEQYDEAYLNLAYMHRALGRYAEAEAAVKRALELDPGVQAATETLATVAGLSETVERLAAFEPDTLQEGEE